MPPEPDRAGKASRWSAFVRYLPRAATYANLAIFALAVWFLHRELANLSLREVLDQIRSSSFSRVGAACLLAVCAYAVLTAYDAVAVRYAGRALPYARTAITSFMAFAVGNNVGIASLSGGPIRYRMYSALGLSGLEIGTVILFCTVTLVLGTGFLLGVALWLVPVRELSDVGIPRIPALAVGAAILAGSVGYVLLPLFRKAPIRIFHWQIEIPRFRVTVTQLVISLPELIFASATLYVLVSPHLDVSFSAFLGIFLVAMSLGLVSNVPGGLGVFEAVMLLAFPDVDREILLGKIIIYRLVYYIGPLLIALVIMGLHEINAHRKPLLAVGDRLADGLSTVAPQVMGTVVFLAGLVLLVSGASPRVESRLRMIGALLPHAVLEISHLAGSLIGLCLLVLARGLYRRLRGAFRIVSALLLLGALFSLLKGFDYEEATILLLAFLLLWITRDQFRRQGSLMHQRFSPQWVAVIVIALIGTAWVGFTSYRHTPYSNELWWQFSLDGDAPRMLRAMLLVTVTAIVFAITKLMRPAPPLKQDVSPEEKQAVRRIIESSESAFANAAFIGGKRFLMNVGETAFIMYQISGRSWVALGNPVGPASEHEVLIWEFRELCDRYDGWPVFYQISDEFLPIYIDMGLTLSKLGEEALVPLAEFSLEGKERADLRQALHRADRVGASFAVVSRENVRELVPQLQAVSDAWLAQKGAAEKGFSLGRFTPEYIQNFDCATVTVDGRIVAFANLWEAPAGGEVAVDLMRYNADAPKSIMDYLFAELLLWAKGRDFARFNLGLAPLSGLETHPLAPMWHRVGSLVFRHAEDFYNFEGLRRYKEKFSPIWHPRYLASPGGLALPRIFLDSSVLISGGFTKMVSH